MWNSRAYKTYLAYATGSATPKKERKFKKPFSPLKKRTLVIVEEEEPEPAKKVKKVLKKSKRETTIHQVGGLGDGIGSELGVLDEPKGKNVDTNEGTGLKPRVPDVSKIDSSKIPTDDEMNDESNDVDEEEYDRIDKELYGDVNIHLTDAEQDDRDEEDADMTVAAHVQVEQTQE
ncbi:hypothetical protein Tco_1333402 [Tanacetum coccineum]